MNPLFIGGAAALVALLAASGSSAATAASQDQMVFKDYQWVTSLPATVPTAPGQAQATLIQLAKQGHWPVPHPLAAHLPPPPNASASGGNWKHYPNGFEQAGNGFVFPIYKGVPGTVDVYAWVPNFIWHPAQGSNVLQVTKVNGYFVTRMPWTVQNTGPSTTRWTSSVGWPPPPPGGGTGRWTMVKPDYVVWLTSANTNASATSTYAFNLSGTPIPPPAAAPIATTPQPAPTTTPQYAPGTSGLQQFPAAA